MVTPVDVQSLRARTANDNHPGTDSKVVHDLPDHIPITNAELDLLSAHLGDIIQTMAANDNGAREA